MPTVPVGVATTLTITAPSGTPGERHLLHAGSSWWVFFLSAANEIDVAGTPDTLPSQWTTTSTTVVLQDYVFAGPTGTLDGRTFGLDVQDNPGLPQPIFHLGLSSTDSSPQEKSHARGTLEDAGPSFGPPVSLQMQTSAQFDGTVTTVQTAPGPPFEVVDFGAVTGQQVTAIVLQDDGDTGDASAPMFAYPELGAARTPSRAAVSLPGGFVALWNEEGAGFSTAMYGDAGTWMDAGVLDMGIGLGWAACSTGTAAHVVWTRSLGTTVTFFHQEMDMTTGAWESSAPAAPSPLGTVTDVFLACQTTAPNPVYAFAIAPSDVAMPGVAPGDIVVSGWPVTDVNSGAMTWTPWTTVVKAPTTGAQRCFLSGFDRVVAVGSTLQAGLLWTETMNSGSNPCSIAGPTSLMTAFVPL